MNIAGYIIRSGKKLVVFDTCGPISHYGIVQCPIVVATGSHKSYLFIMSLSPVFIFCRSAPDSSTLDGLHLPIVTVVWFEAADKYKDFGNQHVCPPLSFGPTTPRTKPVGGRKVFKMDDDVDWPTDRRKFRAKGDDSNCSVMLLLLLLLLYPMWFLVYQRYINDQCSPSYDGNKTFNLESCFSLMTLKITFVYRIVVQTNR